MTDRTPAYGHFTAHGVTCSCLATMHILGLKLGIHCPCPRVISTARRHVSEMTPVSFWTTIFGVFWTPVSTGHVHGAWTRPTDTSRAWCVPSFRLQKLAVCIHSYFWLISRRSSSVSAVCIIFGTPLGCFILLTCTLIRKWSKRIWKTRNWKTSRSNYTKLILIDRKTETPCFAEVNVR